MAFTMSRTKKEDLLRATDPLVTGADLVALASSKDVAVKVAVASRSDCPMASMYSLAQETDPRVLEAVLHNDAAPRGVVVHLAQHRSTKIRELAEARLAADDQA